MTTGPPIVPSNCVAGTPGGLGPGMGLQALEHPQSPAQKEVEPTADVQHRHVDLVITGTHPQRVPEWAIVRVAEHDALARVIPGGVGKVQGVLRTETLIAFQVYSKHDLDSMFSVGFQES